ncbi:lipocalin-like domain-containing protein [Krasilnikovia sp. M28-CT-15]|uniref:lipocalin-like domain-containing protein n=1 Tax=Krasilnikovia sp. M28-CT-15 TaxID=3373540 RepID=UPI0038760A6B
MNAVIGALPRHYERLNLIPGVIQPWEDGLRTDAADGTFEWWYCDAHLEDGSTLTVEFHTKPPYVSPSAPLTPFVLVTLTRPDGSRIDRACTTEPSEFSASNEGCDVSIGSNTFRGGTDGYTVHVEVEDIVADITLTAEVPPWRPATGHTFFGENEEHYIAWLPTVARASAEVTLTLDGATRHLTGTGYHDHNWGNIAPRKVLDHWYWGRARLGDYTIVALMFVSDEAYDKAALPAFLVAKSGRILTSAVGANAVTCTEGDVSVHGTSGVPVARRLEYRVVDGDVAYIVTFQHRQNAFMIDFGRSGAYHRFLGDVTLEHFRDGSTETVRGRTLWELLHFGARPGPEDGAPQAAGGARLPVVGHQA